MNKNLLNSESHGFFLNITKKENLEYGHNKLQFLIDY